MKGRRPKSPEMRARRNKAPETVVLAGEDPRDESPKLGPHPAQNAEKPENWHPLVLDWWNDTWESPQSAQYLTVDVHGLYRCALLMDRFWKTGDSKTSAELRLALERYGQSPLDRLRLRWETARTDEAERKRTTNPAPPKKGGDARLKLA